MANSSFGPYHIAVNESNASRRMVYFSLYSASRETIPMTLGQLTVQPVLHVGGRAAISTTSTVRAADATNGLYYCVLAQSETTVVGQAIMRMSGTSIPETTVTIQFDAVDSGDSMRFGLFSQPNAAAAAAGGLPTFGTGAGQINLSGGSVGVFYIKPAAYSGVSVEVTTGGIQVASIGKGNYSGVSQEICTGGIQVGGIQTTSVGVGNYSGVSMEVKSSGIVAASFKASAIDAAALATDAGQEIADRILLRAIATGSDTGRIVQDALRSNRNRVQIGASIGTVYQEDDTTSAWSFAVTTGTAASITDLDPT